MRGNSGSDQADVSTDTITEPANLRFLRRLVTTLMVVMIFGVISLVGLIVIRFTRPTEIALPDSITLPAGASVEAFTQGRGWYAVVTKDQHILIFDAGTGDLRQDVEVSVGK